MKKWIIRHLLRDAKTRSKYGCDYILWSACKHATAFCQECDDAYAPAVMLKLMTLTHQNTNWNAGRQSSARLWFFRFVAGVVASKEGSDGIRSSCASRTACMRRDGMQRSGQLKWFKWCSMDLTISMEQVTQPCTPGRELARCPSLFILDRVK